LAKANGRPIGLAINVGNAAGFAPILLALSVFTFAEVRAAH
jgi:hypothetical protein